MKTIITYLVFVALAALVCVFGFIGILWWLALVSVVIFVWDFLWPYLSMKYYLWSAKRRILRVRKRNRDPETVGMLMMCEDLIDEISRETKL